MITFYCLEHIEGSGYFPMTKPFLSMDDEYDINIGNNSVN